MAAVAAKVAVVVVVGAGVSANLDNCYQYGYRSSSFKATSGGYMLLAGLGLNPFRTLFLCVEG